MKLSKIRLFTLSFALLTLFSGCGTLTKMRYSRGFKSNLEFNFGKKEKQDEQKIAAKAVKRQNQVREGSTPDAIQPIPVAEKTTVTASFTKVKESKKNFSYLKKQIKTGQALVPKINKKLTSVHSGRPIDPTSAVAGILFYLGLILSVLFESSAFLIIPSIFSTIASVMVILGFILAIVGVGKIKRSNHEYSGMGLDISIIVLFSLMVLASLVFLILLLAFFV